MQTFLEDFYEPYRPYSHTDNLAHRLQEAQVRIIESVIFALYSYCSLHLAFDRYGSIYAILDIQIGLNIMRIRG